MRDVLRNLLGRLLEKGQPVQSRRLLQAEARDLTHQRQHSEREAADFFFRVVVGLGRRAHAPKVPDITRSEHWNALGCAP